MCCEDVIYLGDLKPGIRTLFISCFKSDGFENLLFVYFCMFSRKSHEERIEIMDKIKHEIENLKNFVIHKMKLTMCKNFSHNSRLRYEIIFKNERELVKTILVEEMYEVMNNNYAFNELFQN